MKRGSFVGISAGAVALASAGVGVWSYGHASDAPQAKSARKIELAVYKQDFAMVREGRTVALGQGRNKIGLQDVSKLLDPNSVLFQWDGASKDVQTVSNTYDLGVQDGSGLLRRFMGKKVELIWPSDNGKPGDTIEGTLEASENGGTVIRSDGKYYVNPAGTIVAPSDAGIVTLPQLSAEVDSPSRQDASLNVAYMTRGLSWSADYVATLNPTDSTLQLECWATVTNHTGTDYPDATIALVAGSPNRAVEEPQSQPIAGGDMKAKRGIGFARDYDETRAGRVLPGVAVGELYEYKIPAPATIGQEQMNRVRMLSGQIPVKKDYSIRLPEVGAYDGYWGARDASQRLGAQLAITFDNSESAGLGMPLPSGAVRVYDPGKANQLRYTGAAQIDDTPKDAHVALTLSKVFDVYAQGRTVKRKKIDKKTVRTTVEVVLHNEKQTPVTLRLVQQFYGQWKPVSQSHPAKKVDASDVQWLVDVPAGGETKLTYVVDLKI